MRFTHITHISKNSSDPDSDIPSQSCEHVNRPATPKVDIDSSPYDFLFPFIVSSNSLNLIQSSALAEGSMNIKKENRFGASARDVRSKLDGQCTGRIILKWDTNGQPFIR